MTILGLSLARAIYYLSPITVSPENPTQFCCVVLAPSLTHPSRPRLSSSIHDVEHCWLHTQRFSSSSPVARQLPLLHGDIVLHIFESTSRVQE